MTWLRELSKSEYLYIAAFMVFYISYAIRIYLISKKIKVSLPRLLVKFILRSVYFTLFIIALLGPSFGDIKKEIKDIGKDIYIAIDISKSMDAIDISPTRLEKVKYEFSRVLKDFNSDRVGLIVFSDEAFVQCPLTYDQAALKLFLESISTKMISAGGTDLNSPLALAYSKFGTQIEAAEEQAKVLILISDGEDFNVTTNVELLSKIKKAEIRLFVLGLGTERGAHILTDNGFKRGEMGVDIVSKLNSTKLKEIAELGGGHYYEINSETNDMKLLVNKILKVEGTLKGSRKIDSAANKYFYFLFIALGLVVFDVLISVKTIKI